MVILFLLLSLIGIHKDDDSSRQEDIEAVPGSISYEQMTRDVKGLKL